MGECWALKPMGQESFGMGFLPTLFVVVESLAGRCAPADAELPF
jgi:hypothetical protein